VLECAAHVLLYQIVMLVSITAGALCTVVGRCRLSPG